MSAGEQAATMRVAIHEQIREEYSDSDRCDTILRMHFRETGTKSIEVDGYRVRLSHETPGHLSPSKRKQMRQRGLIAAGRIVVERLPR